MQFERLRKSYRKPIIIGAVAICVIGGALTYATSRAFYRVDDSIDLATGTINYKPYDFKIMAMYKSDDKTNYTEIEEMPSEGYIVNEEKSYCTTDNRTQVKGKIKTINGIHGMYALTKNDKCYIWFDKQSSGVDLILANIKKIEGAYKENTTPDFTQVATGTETEANNGIYVTDDPMYGTNAKSYYWRGAATTNHILFADKCWRIIRINGDNTIRIIYNGTPNERTCSGNGENPNAVIQKGTVYNSESNNSSYVGWTYSVGQQRPEKNSSEINSNLKIQTENWFNDNNNFTDAQRSKVSNGKFCNDRNTENNESWIQNGRSQHYAAYNRVYESNQYPTLFCHNEDIYILKIGAITADEVEYAGASGWTENKLYYLYNGEFYWTMTPMEFFKGQDIYTGVSVSTVHSQSGYNSGMKLNDNRVAIRPVINLRSDVTFSSGDGTLNNPYIVTD